MKTAKWLGRCPVKGCNCIIRIDLPLTAREVVKHNHACGYSYTKTVYDVAAGTGITAPWQLYLYCAVHKRQIGFNPINGKFSEAHQCDDRCLNAKGCNCECSCGGENHGMGHKVELNWN